MTSTKIKRQQHAKTHGIEILTLAVAAKMCQTTSTYTFLEPQLERDARKLQRNCSISHHQCCKQSAWMTNHMEDRKRGDRHQMTQTYAVLRSQQTAERNHVNTHQSPKVCHMQHQSNSGNSSSKKPWMIYTWSGMTDLLVPNGMGTFCESAK